MASAVLKLPGTEPRSVLIVGSGPGKMPEFESIGYAPTYMDIEPRVKPDIVADMTNMGEVGTYDMVFCCHAIEHLYPHQVNLALNEFKRVLNPGGLAIVIVPDLEDVRPTNDILPNYANECKVTGLHLFYGLHSQIAEFPHMAHHCGFVSETLTYAMETAGFEAVITQRMPSYNLIGAGVKR